MKERTRLIGAFCWILLGSAPAFGEGFISATPEGQKACYKVSQDRDRTSSIIRGGKAEVLIAEAASGDQGAHDAEFRAAIQLLFFGTDKQGFALQVPHEYFTAAYWNRLAASATHTVDHGDFKVSYLGQADIIVDGDHYDDALHVKITEIDTSRSLGPIERLLRSPLSLRMLEHESDQVIENMAIDAYLHPSVPGLGAPVLNISGRRYGMNLTMGLDLTDDADYCMTESL